jgi:predicted AlkP superfamily pyrophosphatase or phosphodiesterase
MHRFLYSVSILIALAFATGHAQPKPKKNTLPDRPKLVVGIVVDQMSYDFLVRYQSKFGSGGFRRLLEGGYNCENTHYNYVPTYTAPGHASVYTGSVPAIHGIIGNEWYNRTTHKPLYCTEDTTEGTVGSTSKAGLMSPRNLLATTITDQLRLASREQSKVMGVALKDRGAILPAGHLANAAYWFDSFSGNWITSTYYTKDLPGWVQAFNDKKFPNQYLSQQWTPLVAANTYAASSTGDEQPFEGTLAGESKPVFPHDLPKIRKEDYELLRFTPYGNTLTKDFAVAALQNENLGKGAGTDFLAVSFSSTDYVGHVFGPYSMEAEDTYLRLDRDLADLLGFLDRHVGKDNLLVFLTADHGVAPAPGHAITLRIPGGAFNSRQATDELKTQLQAAFGPGEWIENYSNQQLFLNQGLLREKKLDVNALYPVIRNAMMKQNGVSNVVNLHALSDAMLPDYQLGLIKNGQNGQRSGDVMVLLQPGWMEGRPQGSTHGSFFAYDTHVPLLWYGWKIKPGRSAERNAITDIAPTLANLLGLLEPNGSIGNVIRFE